MIDWLSLIEQHNDFMLARELPEESRREYKERERMARVIRELVRYILILQRTAEVSLAFLDLSPDAKEVVNDTTAPRST